MPSMPMIYLPASTPHLPDPLPLYSRRDPETASIHSSAPSYISEAPTYHSTFPRQSSTLTPPQTPSFAPGYGRGAFCNTGSSVSDLGSHRYNINEWSPAGSGLQAKHYHAVAHRRAMSLSSEEEESRIQSLARCLTNPAPAPPSMLVWAEVKVQQADSPEEASTPRATPPLTPPNGRSGEYFSAASSSSPSSSSQRQQQWQRSPPTPESENEPYNPREDPALVGHAAAREARERRLYLENHDREQAALNQESKTWDFMLSQMADWNERERSWEKFRKEVGRSRILGRRLGL
ncbi:hypothetical protein MMC25_005900 [Agyrium rufum]|nr:hypothetical protein [Agyrium rufum]